jgi:ketosteroid isomerase-like protein
MNPPSLRRSFLHQSADYMRYSGRVRQGDVKSTARPQSCPVRKNNGSAAMSFEELLARFTAAVEAGDGEALAALFAADGVYHDTFYGAFAGRPAIAGMLRDFFYRDAEAFRWDMRDPVSDGRIGYARWAFSYVSRLPESRGRRVAFSGMSRFVLAGDLIERYDEVFNAGLAFVQLDMAPGRVATILGRMSEASLRGEFLAGHIAARRRT